jgi:hypothetical protein
MEQEILQRVLDGRNIIIIGETNSGKSYFVKNEIIPLLEKNNFKVSYSEDCESLKINSRCDVFIVDEVEILFDKEFLENMYPEKMPYYTDNYLKKVKSWLNKLSKITKPIICTITRNGKTEIDYVYENYKSLEWNNLPVDVVKFEKR